jgi:hypothetical protein
MAEKKSLHTHKFKRLRYKSGNEIFFCVLPDCSQKINPALALGKRSICWRCGEPFIMNEYSLRLSKPHCEACHKPKKEVDYPVVGTLDERFVTGEDQPLSLSERLSQTINSAKQEEDEI